MLVLSLVDFLFFRVGTICGANRGAFQTAEETIKKPTLGRFVHFIRALLCTRDPKQTFRCHAACCARTLYLVAESANHVVQRPEPPAVCRDFGDCQRVDNLGTAFSLGRDRAGLDTNMAGTFHHRRSRAVVLSKQTNLAKSADFYLSAVED